MVAIYFAGAEDCDHYEVGGGTVDTTSTHFRSAYARCGLSAPGTGTLGVAYWQNSLTYSESNFWWSARHADTYNGNPGSTCELLAFVDPSNVKRLRIIGATGAQTFGLYTLNAAGTATQLGSNFVLPLSAASANVDKLDININYSTTGSITIYLNGVQYFTYSGNITTDSATALGGHRLGGAQAGFSGVWSEIVVSDTDTRSWTMETFAPVANGNTHNFDTGSPAASNVNETTLNDTTLDGSTTAGQIDQYTIGSLASGTWSIIAFGVSARAIKGASGPSKMDLNVRSTSDYFSSDQVLATNWGCYQNWWTTDPNTSAAWAALPSNIGLKSVT